MSTQAPLYITMHAADNVAIVANDGGLSAGTVLPSGLVLRDHVPQGHKVALEDLAEGDTVRRYDVPIGYANKAIPAGSWVHERLLKMPAARALAAMGAEVVAWDDGEAARAAAQSAPGPAESGQIAMRDPAPEMARFDALVLSPGIPHRYPAPHPSAAAAAAAGVPVWSDAELLFQAVRRSESKARFAGITGTNGKSTTTALLAHILEKQVKDVVFVTGDIHTFIGGDVRTDLGEGRNAALEFVGGSITMTSLGETDLNENEGAESTLAFHRAQLLLDAAALPAADRRRIRVKAA